MLIIYLMFFSTPCKQVKILLHLNPLAKSTGTDVSPCLTVDRRRKQVGLIDPNLSHSLSATQRRAGMGAPKFFSMDGIFTEEDSLVITSFILLFIMHSEYHTKQSL